MGPARVAVVGGGLAGLAAAVELQAAGFEAELFERGRLLGGRATSFVVDGREVDNGQHVFLGCCTELIDLIRRLGLSDRMRLQHRFDARVFGLGGRSARLRAASLPAPWHLAAGLLGYQELGWADRARVGRALLAVAGRRQDERPLAGWLREQHQSAEALRGFWEPFFVPALNAPLAEVSVAEAAFIVATAFLSDAGGACFGWLTVPLARLAEAAAERLSAVHRRTPVTRLERLASGAVSAVWTADGGRFACEAAVLAVPPGQLVRLLGDPAEVGLPPLGGFVSRPIVDVHLWHDRGPLGFEFAALLGSPVQWVFEKATGYLCCSLSDAGRVLTEPEPALVQLAWAEVTERVPVLAGAALEKGAATRTPEATYAAPPGTRRPGPGTDSPNLAVAGSWTDTGWPDTMESAVRSGRAAARHLTAHALRDVAHVA